MEQTNIAVVPRTERSVHGSQPANLARQRGTPADAGASFGALLGALGCDTAAEADAAPVLADAVLPQDLPAAPSLLADGMTPAPAEAAQTLLADAAVPEGLVGAEASSSAARIAVLMQSAAALPPVTEAGRGLPAGVTARAGDSGARRDGNAAKLRATDRPDPLVQPAAQLTPPVLPDPSIRSAAPDSAAAEALHSGARASAIRNGRMEQQHQWEASVAQSVSTHGGSEAVVANAATLLLDGLGGGAKILTAGREPDRKTQAAGAVTGPSWMETSAQGSASLTAPSFVLDAGMASPEVAVAEQVHYWVTKGVQNAELQLDAFGGGQVEVHVSVVGNEAQVEFRTDQPEARRLLQDAMPQLRQMLEQEGMLLSGGFVGTSTRQDQEPNTRQPARAPEGARVPATVSLPSAGQTLGARGSGRTLDVFV